MAIKNIFYLGVEGGATKSTAILADESGKTIWRGEGDALNYHVIGEEAVESNLRKLLKPVKPKTKASKLISVLGLSGLDTKEDFKTYGEIAKNSLPDDAEYRVVNDSEIALASKCPNEKNGIVAISGTGANVFGKSDNKVVRTVGWDYILGDEGSSYDAGLKAMRAATRSWDGRGEKTLLEKLVMEKIGVSHFEDFINKVYKVTRDDPSNAKYFIASFSNLIDKAITKEDKTAIGIRENIVEEFSLAIKTVTNKLKLNKEMFCVGFVGSGWKMPLLKAKVKRAVQKEFPKVYFSKNDDISGVAGAINLAMKK